MAPRVIPAPGVLPDHKRDAREAFEMLKAGGTIIIPTDVGYGLMSASNEGIERCFHAKNRKKGHTLGVIGTFRAFQELNDVTPEQVELIRVVTQEMDQQLNTVAPLKNPVPQRMAHLTPENFDRVTRRGTLAMNIGESPFQREIGRLNDEAGQLMIGSSANMTGAGQKLRVEDFEPQIRAAADLIVDYGLQRYHRYQRSGTILDVSNMKVYRIGAGYEVLRERIKKWFGHELPEDPDYKTDKVGVSHSIMTADADVI
ncbi:DHBP synthase RibB-like alpha/beta domain-containing protein [Nemania sp. FL0916]|nr:DHBP synthase RibB-like alpha/beta domain-containing protein [Nemania sp. FL0916]